MTYIGNIRKMRSEFADPVSYFLPVGVEEIPMNELIGRKIKLRFTGVINCIHCGIKTKTSFGQGFCYKCFQTAPEASESVLQPERSKAHLGIARDMEWARQNDLIEHVVYLAVSSDLKVGVTRYHQVPTRWIDQGASSTIKLAQTPNRHIAGVVEVYLKRFLNDKTNWRDMLKNKIARNIDLILEKERIGQLLPLELQQYLSNDDTVTELQYPVLQFPGKPKSLSFDKTPEITKQLMGIKGQYLIFADQTVLNIRRHNGYELEVETEFF